MCEECGCLAPKIRKPRGTRIELEIPVLQANQSQADKNRELFAQRGLRVINLISSPGSGKTTLLQALANRMGPALAVIVGDLRTDRDAVRIRAAGCQAVQIETQGACHLDAPTVAQALGELNLDEVKLLVIENVGNLVCPASYDLGEHEKVALLSTPEGDDKVLKYPSIFCRISTLAITKTDLLPYLDFDPERAETECRSLNPKVTCWRLSAKTGAGLEPFWEHLLATPT